VGWDWRINKKKTQELGLKRGRSDSEGEGEASRFIGDRSARLVGFSTETANGGSLKKGGRRKEKRLRKHKVGKMMIREKN